MAVGNASPVLSVSPCGEHNVGTKRPIWNEATSTQTMEYEWPCGCIVSIITDDDTREVLETPCGQATRDRDLLDRIQAERLSPPE